MGILLISQFWTLANEIYDARQAKRLFGFIGAGASLGGIAGSSLLTFAVEGVRHQQPAAGERGAARRRRGARRSSVEARSSVQLSAIAKAGEEKGVGGGEALRMLRESRHLQVISLVIAFGAIGAYLIEQQLNMAAEAFKGRSAVDSLTAFLGTVQLYTSIAGFLIQVLATSRIHRLLGIGFALLILPVSLGTSAAIMLANAALWAPVAGARLRHLAALHRRQDDARDPVPAAARPVEAAGQAVRRRDRRPHSPRASAALLALVLIAPWGLNLDWQRVSYASLAVCGLWIFTAVKAKQRLHQRLPPGPRPRRRRARHAARCRPPTPRRSRRWSPSWPIPTRRASATPSTCSSRSTSAT